MNYTKFKKKDLIGMLNIKDKTVKFLKEQVVDKEIKDLIGSSNTQLYTVTDFSMDWYKTIIERTIPIISQINKDGTYICMYRMFKKDGNLVLIEIDNCAKKPKALAFFKRLK